MPIANRHFLLACALITLSGCATDRERATADVISSQKRAQAVIATAQRQRSNEQLAPGVRGDNKGIENPEPLHQEVESALQEQYSNTLRYCQAQIQPIKQRLSKQKKTQAYTSAGFGFLALLGSVAGYPPVKTILTGLGVAGASGGSVSDTANSYFEEVSEGDAKELGARQTQLMNMLSSYGNGKYSSSEDPTGGLRQSLLAMMSATCDGTLVSAVAPSESGASAAEPADPKASDAKGNANRAAKK